MSLVNKTAVRTLAKSMDMKISADSMEAAEARLKVILEHAAKKAQQKKRKTILKRDFIHEIDLFDGKPWVSVVAFTMEKIRPRNLPSFTPISNFDEINIRTYIKSKEKTGVYFLSIEGGNYLSCKVAKGISKLPYRYSKIKRTKNQFKSSNSVFDDSLNLEYSIGEEVVKKTEFDLWLTERYALFQDTDKSINEYIVLPPHAGCIRTNIDIPNPVPHV